MELAEPVICLSLPGAGAQYGSPCVAGLYEPF